MPYHVCGCYFFHPTQRTRQYLPQVKLEAHTTVLSTASRTVLKQNFINPSEEEIEEITYAFPLFDGVSVVDFVCKVQDRTIYGLVKEKAEARKTYEEAKQRGEKAALLEQLPDAADVFTTSISNIPKSAAVEVSITYVQELKHDAEVDGVRLTIPTSISPRYGAYPGTLVKTSSVDDTGGISLAIDVHMAEGIPIRKILSPSHPIEVSLGSLTTSSTDDDLSLSKASATLALGTTQLQKDFVLQIVAKDVGVPQAILETHPTLPNQRALMTTLVPKFNLKPQKPEIIFVVDRSGSMSGNMGTVISALKTFLKSIPVGCMFNICSFGSRHSFVWPKSQLYSQDTLAEAIKHVSGFSSDFGGTETLSAVKACFEARLPDMQTELMLLTDGDIWSQQQMFDYISNQTKTGDVRVFPIGIGGDVSSALIEGIARAGNGFAQMVGNNEKLDSKIIRMLKGALTPHIADYRLEIKYENGSIDSVTENSRIHLDFDQKTTPDKDAKPISLYDTNAKEEHPKADESTDIFAGLPKLNRPRVLQTPQKIPSLFPFNRTSVYLLLSPSASDAKPTSVFLKGTSPQGPLELEIPVEARPTPDQMIHQLAARKAIQELEEGRGWITEAVTDGEGAGETTLVSRKYPTKFALLQRREAVRLGVEFQVGGKYCSFVAVEANEAEMAKKRQQIIDASARRTSGEESDDWEMVLDDAPKAAAPKPASGFLSISMGGDGSPQPEGTQYGFSRTSLHSAPTAFAMASPRKGMTGLSSSSSARMAYSRSSPLARMDTSNFDAEFSTSSSTNEPVQDPTLLANQFAGFSYTRPNTIHAALAPHKKKRTDQRHNKFIEVEADVSAEHEEEDIDYSDEDMGYGLFDSPTYEPAPVSNAPVAASFSATSPSYASASASYAPASVAFVAEEDLEQYQKEMQCAAAMPLDDPDWEEEESISRATLSEGEVLESIITQQSFEGSWDSINASLKKAMGVNWEEAGKAISSLAGTLDRVKADAALNTAIVVLYLEKKFSHEEETWELIVEKARTWLEENVEEAALETVWSHAKRIV